MKKYIKTIIDRLAQLLPDNYYFRVVPALHILGSNLERKGGVEFVALKRGLYEARSRNSCQNRIYFCERTRYHRYLYADGPNIALHRMLNKYCISDSEHIKESVVVDIGANIGEFSMAVAPLARNVFSFEPDPLVQEALCLNLSRFKNVKVEPIALSNKSGSVPFYLSTKNADSSFVKPRTWSSIVHVKTLTLDDFIRQKGIDRIDFLKLDAEGWEPEVLEGASSALAITRHVCIDAGPEREGVSTLPQVEAILKKAGFDVICFGYIVLGRK